MSKKAIPGDVTFLVKLIYRFLRLIDDMIKYVGGLKTYSYDVYKPFIDIST